MKQSRGKNEEVIITLVEQVIGKLKNQIGL